MENNDDDMDFNNVECQNIATNAVKLIVPDEKNAQAEHQSLPAEDDRRAL